MGYSPKYLEKVGSEKDNYHNHQKVSTNIPPVCNRRCDILQQNQPFDLHFGIIFQILRIVYNVATQIRGTESAHVSSYS